MGRDYKDIVRELWVRVPIMLDRAERNLEKQEENYWNIVGMMAGATPDEEMDEFMTIVELYFDGFFEFDFGLDGEIG